MTQVVLGIETSCDDTSVCILRGKKGTPLDILAFGTFGQEHILSEWGGVVPEIAARNHLLKLAPLMKSMISKANITPEEIDYVGITTQPGLLGPLLTGLNGAKSFALAYKTPIVPVNHLFAHIEAIHLTEEKSYPYMGLIISGGHSLFVLVTSAVDFEVLGGTIDDAAGEAFDKGGKLLDLGYPAGRIIDELASLGDEKKYKFPIGLKSSKTCELSYSGLKTQMRLHIEKNGLPEKDSQEMKDICASYQLAIVDALKLKTKFAMEMVVEKLGREVPIVVGGGVAANSKLRNVLSKAYKDISFVEPRFCTDNGAMIANYALRTFEENKVPFPECLSLDAKSRFGNRKERLEQAREKAIARKKQQGKAE